ncbi:unnamed protein product [Caenorhabditis angaria]|uniref:Uncharacterized protein n=1 Tax=Caenorhabditis angaria TaxID=860376 RepID=A0A9P1IC41_9PELO|nr:unnamed protein product [Caenorhabditis angaria]
MGIRPNFAEDVYGDRKTEESDQPEYSESSLAHRRSANVLKLKQVKEAQPLIGTGIGPINENVEIDKDLDFEYGDSDTGIKEMAELYSYSEMEEFALNINCWKEYMETFEDSINPLPRNFEDLTESQKDFVIQDLCTRMESADSGIRLKSARNILFILQGSVTDFANPENEQIEYQYDKNLMMNVPVQKSKELDPDGPLQVYQRAVKNSFVCYRNGVYQSLCTLLMTEIKEPYEFLPSNDGRISKASSRDSKHASYADLSDSERNKQGPTMADNEMLRIIMSSIYHMIVQILDEKSGRGISEAQNIKEKEARLLFKDDIQEPIENGNEPLLIVLLNMLHPFYIGTSPHYPIKKMVLLIWKVLLLTLGGWQDIESKKQEKRKKAGLEIMENTLKVAESMPAFILKEQDEVKNLAHRPGTLARAGMMARQMAYNDDSGRDDDDPPESASSSSGNEEVDNRQNENNDKSGEQTPRVGSPVPVIPQRKILPWRSKTTSADIEKFIESGRHKYFNYNFDNSDTTTLFGFPPSFIGAVNILRKNRYESLSEKQIAEDEELNRYLFSRKEAIEETKTEEIYRKLLPNMSQYICSLVKVLVSSVPSNKEGLNVLIDLLTPEMEASDILSNSISLDHSTSSPLEDGFRLAIDINRHKEIIVKSLSSILLLLVKHFKLNHIYQFEFICQQIVYVNGIPLILKFLDQNTTKYIQSRHEIYAYNYPQCLYHYVRNGEEWPILTQDNIEEPRSPYAGPYFMWRNVFYTINLVRLLNKLVKGKNDRVKMLMAFKSAPILKRLLKVRVSILQLYILKAIKMQSRFLGRQWRKTNMATISAIYSRVRHRMTDDWAFSSDIKRKCDYQKEDNLIKASIERFHSRRYAKYYPQFAIEVNDAPMPGDDYLNRVDMRDFEPVDNCAHSVLGLDITLGKKFKQNYEKWMEQEVFRAKINWDKLLIETRGFEDLLLS